LVWSGPPSTERLEHDRLKLMLGSSTQIGMPYQG